MAGTQKRIVYLDTHIVVWLYDALTDKLSKKSIELINEGQIFISPLVKLELEYLYEIKKIKVKPAPIITSLKSSIGMSISQTPFEEIIDVAVAFDWTRDPFDRILVAEAQVNNAYFVTKDKIIMKNYPLAV